MRLNVILPVVKNFVFVACLLELNGCSTNADSGVDKLPHQSSSTPKPRKATPQAEITSANFVSLAMERSPGVMGYPVQMMITQKSIQIHDAEKDKGNTGRQRVLSGAELQSLLKTLNDERFTHIASRRDQFPAADAITYSVRLKLQTQKGKYKTFAVSNYDANAPARFDAVLNQILKLQSGKFSKTRPI